MLCGGGQTSGADVAAQDQQADVAAQDQEVSSCNASRNGDIGMLRSDGADDVVEQEVQALQRDIAALRKAKLVEQVKREKKTSW